MRFVLAILLGGCIAGSLDANSRPAVIPKLSELPEDHAQRDAVLDQSHETAGPEQRKGMTKKERKIETAAALAAAIIGDAFSSDHNVTLGISTDTDPVKPMPLRQEAETGSGSAGSGSAGSASSIDSPPGPLLPWVKLK